MNLNDLRTFVRAAELGTFTAVAREEGVPRSTITRRVARLEESMGVELVRRSARSFALTEDGELMHRQSQGPLRDLANVELALSSRSEKPRGRLVVSVPDFGRAESLTGLFIEYQKRFVEVAVEVRVENVVVDLVHAGVDVAFRAFAGQIPGTSDLMSRVFDLAPAAFYASPKYLHERGEPKALDDLDRHALVSGVLERGTAISLASQDKTVEVNLSETAFQSNDMMLVRSVIEAGLGVGLLPGIVAEPGVAQGRLRRVLHNWSLSAGRIALVWPAGRHLSPRVRAFVDLATGVFAGANPVHD